MTKDKYANLPSFVRWQAQFINISRADIKAIQGQGKLARFFFWLCEYVCRLIAAPTVALVVLLVCLWPAQKASNMLWWYFYQFGKAHFERKKKK